MIRTVRDDSRRPPTTRAAGAVATLFGIVFALPSLAAALSGEATLEADIDYRCVYPAPSNFVDRVTGRGTIPLTLPPDGGPVQASGTFTHQGTGYSFAGPLVLDGRLEDDTLYFPFPKGYSDGMQVYNRNDPVAIPARRDAVVVFDMESREHGVHCSGAITWRLLKPTEHWRVTIADEGNLVAVTSTGGFDEAGVTVKITRDIEVTVERGQFKEGPGTARFDAIVGYSRPPGIYNCKSASTQVAGSGTDIETERLDQTKWAKRFNPPKTPADVELKKQWEAIKMQETPLVYPARFATEGVLTGRTLDLALPEKSGYTVAIYCRLQPKPGRTVHPRQETLDTERAGLTRRFEVQLVDGWHYEESWTLVDPRKRQTAGTTRIDVAARNQGTSE